MRIGIISASIRDGRLTHRVALALQDALLKIEAIDAFIVDLKETPVDLWEATYTSNSENRKHFDELKDTLDEADGFIFVSPEYNGSYTSALKNLIDFFPKSSFSKKAIAVVSVTSGKLGGMRAALNMQQLVLAIFAYPQPNMLLVPEVHEKFNELGVLLDKSFAKTIEGFLSDYLWLCKALDHSRINFTYA